MLVVIALGGNALLRRGEPMEADLQRRNLAEAAAAIAEVAHEHRVVVTHGNGPQVGLLALQAAAYGKVRPYPLDLLGAESEGLIGYMIEQELGTQLPDRDIATLLTQVVVDPDDPAFQHPSKPIGPVYGEAEARRLMEERRWMMAPDGDGFRRVVASPRPQAIIEIRTIRLLVGAGVLVVSAGGGGVPVAIGADGAIRGVEAVIDKDRSAALLAGALGADALLILTDVDAVYSDFATPKARAIAHATPDQLAGLDFPAGSMGPKVEAACQFVTEGGAMAAIGAVADAAAMLRGAAGTVIEPGDGALAWYDPKT